MTDTTEPSFEQIQREVEMLVLAQGTIEKANAVIEASDLSEEEQAALWLYAWALLPIAYQRPEALARLAQMTRST